jgi:hypothetical protein
MLPFTVWDSGYSHSVQLLAPFLILWIYSPGITSINFGL